MITDEILRKIETLLRTEFKNKDLVLSDYFDYISGTSTGAIIAASILVGWFIDKVHGFYFNSGVKMFDRTSFFKKLKYSYEDID